jgi:hypothetical protein
MTFKELITLVKDNDINAIKEITAMYKPLLVKESVINGVFDEDLYQELWLTLLNCVRKIKI